MHLFHLYHMMHYSLHLMFILLHPHGVPVSVCMCFACACLGDNHMSFSRVLCVRDDWSMYAFGRIAANSVFIFLNKLLPSPDALCFFPCCH